MVSIFQAPTYNLHKRKGMVKDQCYENLKFKLGRNLLKPFILPSLDLYFNTVMLYGITVRNTKNDDLEKIQILAARIAIGGTKLISIMHSIM